VQAGGEIIEIIGKFRSRVWEVYINTLSQAARNATTAIRLQSLCGEKDEEGKTVRNA
jgi:hypothetical protein